MTVWLILLSSYGEWKHKGNESIFWFHKTVLTVSINEKCVLCDEYPIKIFLSSHCVTQCKRHRSTRFPLKRQSRLIIYINST